MLSHLHSSSAASPLELCKERGLPVLVADHPLHRRVSVHYLWIPGRPDPEIHRALPEVLDRMMSAGHRAILVIAGAAPRTILYYRLDATTNPEEYPYG